MPVPFYELVWMHFETGLNLKQGGELITSLSIGCFGTIAHVVSDVVPDVRAS
jgi:hypothetical protein